MPTCGVRFCGNSDKKNKKNGTDTSFFRPPTATTGKPWISPEHLKPSQTDVRVCSDHFLPTDFVTTTSVKILKPESVPTLKLPRTASHTLTINKASISVGGESQVVAGEVVINVRFENKSTGRDLDLVELRDDKTAQTSIAGSYPNEMQSKLNRKLQKLRKRLSKAEQKLKIRKQTRIKVLESVHQDQKRGLNTRNVYLRKQNDELKQKLGQSQAMLNKCFSPAQLQVLQKGHSGTNWSEEDISKAIVLKARSSSGYELVRTAWGIPLPGRSTLRRWISKIDFETGILKPVMSLLTQEFSLASKFRQKCVISFDEMGVDGLIDYDVKNDKIVGPHTNFMVAFARGLLEKYKQPIFADFDFKFTKPTMQAIFTSLRKANLEPCAVVCDLQNLQNSTR